MADFSIRATPNGPYIVQGDVELLDTAGDKYPLDKESIAFCRCGQSSGRKELATSSVNVFAANCIVRKNEVVGTVTRRPLP